mmetsp:Transcript_13225/g.23997  ORF Transcript_13225/g.23997 Transcript_13225/m.23997 type:complete len:312 (-) Transcript_13225:159-1094(-)
MFHCCRSRRSTLGSVDERSEGGFRVSRNNKLRSGEDSDDRDGDADLDAVMYLRKRNKGQEETSADVQKEPSKKTTKSTRRSGKSKAKGKNKNKNTRVQGEKSQNLVTGLEIVRKDTNSTSLDIDIDEFSDPDFGDDSRVSTPPRQPKQLYSVSTMSTEESTLEADEKSIEITAYPIARQKSDNASKWLRQSLLEQETSLTASERQFLQSLLVSSSLKRHAAPESSPLFNGKSFDHEEVHAELPAISRRTVEKGTSSSEINHKNCMRQKLKERAELFVGDSLPSSGPYSPSSQFRDSYLCHAPLHKALSCGA